MALPPPACCFASELTGNRAAGVPVPELRGGASMLAARPRPNQVPVSRAFSRNENRNFGDRRRPDNPGETLT
jgi:hypothetical protein